VTQVRSNVIDIEAIAKTTQVPYLSSVVDSADYSHFPVIAFEKNVMGMLFKSGPQHDSSHHTGVCLSQKPAAGGAQNLVINGVYASGGVATPLAATKVEILSDANEAALNFTVYGLVNGVADSETIAGPAGGYTTAVVTTKVFSTVTQVQVSGNTVGNVRVGLFMVPQNIEYKYSTNGAYSWSSSIKIFDGVTDLKNYYWGALGVRKDRTFIALCTEITIPTDTRRALRKTSIDGIDWSTPAEQITITGDVPSTCAFFSKVHMTPGGRLVVGVYDDTKSYIMHSDNGGLNWVSKLIITDGATTYSEITVAIIDERRWIAMLRVDNVAGSMVQFKTEDANGTWTTQGDTNLPSSGGYKSHDLATFYRDGKTYVALTYMSRQTATAVAPNINSISMRVGEAEKLLVSPLNWEPEHVVVDSATILAGYTAPGTERSLAGYPSLWISPFGDQAILAYARETAYYHAARVETKKVDVAAVLENNTWTPVLSFATPGDLAVTYATQVGKVTKIGRLVFAHFEIVTSAFTHTTASGALRVTGLPYVSGADGQTLSGGLEWRGITKASFTQITARVGPNANQVVFRASGSGQTPGDVVVADVPTAGTVRLIGTVIYYT
jgi:hypothetical protein